MIELFSELTPEFKERAKAFIDLTIRTQDLPMAVYAIKNFSNNCSENEQEFIDFYLSLRARQVINESDYDQRQE